jgi:hypothetical protein
MEGGEPRKEQLEVFFAFIAWRWWGLALYRSLRQRNG